MASFSEINPANITLNDILNDAYKTELFMTRYMTENTEINFTRIFQFFSEKCKIQVFP